VEARQLAGERHVDYWAADGYNPPLGCSDRQVLSVPGELQRGGGAVGTVRIPDSRAGLAGADPERPKPVVVLLWSNFLFILRAHEMRACLA
jgi:hypothetical protein